MPDGMKAALLCGPYDVRVERVSKPAPSGGLVLVKTLVVGICGTDKAFYRGTYKLLKKPLIPGHEAVGVVVEGPEDLVGRTVVPEINIPCLKCSMCREGFYTHCVNKRTLGIDFDGAMAEYFLAHREFVHEVEGVDPLTAVFAEPLAAILNAIERTPVTPLTSAAVVGAGSLAHLLTQVLNRLGCRPVVVVRDDSPKRKFFERLDCEIVEASRVRDYVAKRTRDGLGFDVVFEVSGDPGAARLAVELARPRGIVHLKSTPGAEARVDTTMAVVKELSIVTSRCGRYQHFEKAIDMLRAGDVKPLATAVVEGVEGIPQAFETALRRDQLKVLVRVGG